MSYSNSEPFQQTDFKAHRSGPYSESIEF